VFVRVPATSANLGPGFDALGLALNLHLELRDSGPPAHADHPATQAYRSSGGTGTISLRTTIPPARGLGFSGACRVAGCLAAHLENGLSETEAREVALLDAIKLEGHADNAAPSMLGGLVICTEAGNTHIPVDLDTVVLVWVPETKTSTKKSRSVLPSEIDRSDAVFNLSRAALLVAALTTGRPELLATATQDRLHQDLRLAASPGSRSALEAMRGAGAWGAWLSGSGPSVAALVDPIDAERITLELPAEGRVLSLSIDNVGTVVDMDSVDMDSVDMDP
jgi:homoserine kinase